MGNALIFTLGGKYKPSGSAAADMEDYLPDSEYLISQPQSHSKRGRKKPVIKKSQEEPSQQVQLHYKIVFNIILSYLGE